MAFKSKVNASPGTMLGLGQKRDQIRFILAVTLRDRAHAGLGCVARAADVGLVS